MKRTIEVILTAHDASLKSALVSSGTAVDAFGGKLEKADKRASGMSDRMKAGLVGAGAAVAGALGFAVKSAAEFDASMHNVNSLMGLSSKQLSAYSQQVIGLSTKLPQSPKELADGLYEIASSGFEGQKGLQVLGAAATAASAGLTDTETAADAIVSVLHSYGESAADAGKVSDSLFQTVNLGVLSFGDLAQGIGQVVGIASTAHVSIDQVGAAIATMTRTGIVPAEAFTSLNQLITRLIKPTDALQAVYDKLGYQSGEAALAQKGLGGVMADINRVTGGSATATVTLMGDIRAARGAFALGAQGGRLYNQMLQGMGHSAGETGKVLAEQSKSASYQFKLLKNDVTAAGISVGTALLPYMVKGAHGIEQLIHSAQSGSTGLGHLADEVESLVKGFFHLAAGVQHGLAPLEHVAVGATIGGLTELAHLLGQIVGFAEDHQGAVKALVLGFAGLKIGKLATGGLERLAAPGGILDGIGARALIAKDGLGQITSNIGRAEGAAGKLKATAGGLGSVARTAGGGLLALAGGPVGVATMAVGAGIIGWENYKAAIEQAGEAADRISKNINFWDPKSFAQGQEALKKQETALDNSQKHASLWHKAMRYAAVGVSFDLKHYGDTADALVGGSGKAAQRAQKDRETFALYGKTIQAVAGRLGISADAVQLLGQRAHVSDKQMREAGSGSGKALDQVTQAVSRQMSTSAKATDSVQGITSALKTFSDTESTAADRANALENAIEGLVNPGINLQQSVEGWESAMRGAVSTASKAKGVGIDPLTHAFRTNSERGTNAAKAMNDLAQGMSKTVAGMAKAGEPTSHMNRVLADTSKKFHEAGVAAGLTEPQIRSYAKVLGLTPRAIKTIIREYGSADAKQKVAGLSSDLKKVPKEVRTAAKVLGAADAADQFYALRRNAGGVPKVVLTKASAPGARQATLDLINVGRKAAGLPPLKRLPVTVPGATNSIGVLDQLKSAVQKIPGHKASDIQAIDNATGVLKDVLGDLSAIPRKKTSTVTVEETHTHTDVYRTIGQRVKGGGGKTFFFNNALGSIMSFADGKLPKDAMIARDGANLVQWAEPGTGDEAFIPMAPARRGRSRMILDEVASRFGLRLVADDQDDDVLPIVESYASGGTRSSQERAAAHQRAVERHRRAVERQRQAAQRRREKELKERHQQYLERVQQRHRDYEERVAERRRAYQERQEYGREQRRLAAPVALTSSLYDASGAVSAFTDQATTAASNRAELLANRAQRRGNASATAADFLRAPRMMTADYLRSFDAQLKHAATWEKNLATIAHRAGSKVALQLRDMGAEGEALVSKMANTTEAQTRRMGKALTDLAGTAHKATQDFQLELRDSTARSAQFNKDLLTLLSRGDVGLVAKLQDMGVDAGYQIARQAVTERGRDKSLEHDIGANNGAATDEHLAQALQLATILTKHKGDLGIAGLASESGMSVADVWVLLTQYNSQVFHRLAGKMGGIRRDQALVAAGKSITGLAAGGIVDSAHTASGLYYRWAEPRSGGESLIPHGPQHRARARQLWMETGRILGMGPAASSPVRMVSVQPGAVRMELTVNGSNLSPAQVQEIAARQTTAAMGQLVNQLKAR